ncbi:MAG: hypothetical protein ABI723_26215 [Bacteroidia bacterium]
MAANLEFTGDEYNVMHDATFFIHKKKITEKLVTLFGDLNLEMEKLLLQYADLLPATVINSKGKINKGENYEYLPYIILDSPRVFSIDNVFAFRTMFRWGNYFSCTVQLSGIYLEAFKPRLIEFISNDNFNHYYICTSDDEWQHHFRADNYTLATEVLNNQKVLNAVMEQAFFKVAIQLPLEKSGELKTEAIRFYKSFLDCYTTI